MAAVASDFVIAIGGAVTTVAAVEASATLAMAINNTPDPNVTEHEATQVGDQVGAPPMDTQRVRDIYNQLPRGKNKKVRTVGSDAELQSVFDQMTVGGKPLPPEPGYKGIKTELPDGTTIGLRDGSLSGGRTIDIWWPGESRGVKIHIAGE